MLPFVSITIEYKDSFDTSKEEDATYDSNHRESRHKRTRSEDIIRQYHEDQESRSNSSSRSRQDLQTPSEDYARTKSRQDSRNTSNKDDARARTSKQQQRTPSENLARTSDRESSRTASTKDDVRTRSSKQELQTPSKNLKRTSERQNSRTTSIKHNTRASRQEERIPHDDFSRTNDKQVFRTTSRGDSETRSSQVEEFSEAVYDMEQGVEDENSSNDPNGDVVHQGQQDNDAHQDRQQDDDNKEFFEYLDSFGEDAETLISSSDAEVDGEPKIIHLDHVDYILDNIDAELSHLINKVCKHSGLVVQNMA